MKKGLLKPAFLLLVVLAAGACSGSTEQDASPPNILLIVADDLGYSDLGFLGGEIETPNIDQLAAGGLFFANFHVAPYCTPTRLQLMTGLDDNLVGVSDERGFHLSTSVPTMAEVLSDSGYETIMAGKWDLGWARGLTPADRGFQQSFALLPGAADHFNRPHPGERASGMTALNENGDDVSPGNYYSTSSFSDKLIEYLSNRLHPDRPFFAFASYTAPHWPLQAPREVIEKYLDTYASGYESIADRRLSKLASSTYAQLYEGPYKPTLSDWDTMSAEQQASAAKHMAVYAAMVDVMDVQIGRLLEHLRDTNQFDNTVIIFLSDNGADPSNDDNVIVQVVDSDNIDNSYGNLGLPGSYIAYGEDWAKVSSVPFNGLKNGVLEGGIRVPAIVQVPDELRERRASVELVDIRDLVATIYDLAGASAETLGALPIPIDGRSLKPLLEGRELPQDSTDYMAVYNVNRYTGVEGASLTKGPWKIVGAGQRGSGIEWRLYNLDSDPGETNDLLSARPDVAGELFEDWREYQQRIGTAAQQ